MDIRSDVEIQKAYEQMSERILGQGISANELAFTVQEMVSGGRETIMGLNVVPDFGHMVMFGLGGIYTEVLKDMSFTLAPLAKEESLRMIQGIKALPILEGVRGEKGVSLDLLSEYLIRLSLLVHDFPQIEEIDLNPVKGFESELYVVDARVIQRT